MTTAEIDPGICGLKTKAVIQTNEDETISVTLDSNCPAITAMETALQHINPLEAAFGKIGTDPVHNAAARHCKHPGCPVPGAIIKAIEIESGFALPKDVSINFSK